MSDFKDFLRTQALRFPTKQEFARAIGITPGRFSRLLGGQYSMEVVNCLRLAKISGESPARVLRLAGKTEIADLIDELYGRASYTKRQREVMALWDLIPAERQDPLLYTMQVFAADATGARREPDLEGFRAPREQPRRKGSGKRPRRRADTADRNE